MSTRHDDERHMARALEAAATVRAHTSPNPWVGALLVTTEGDEHVGATEPRGGRHAEVVAIEAADDGAPGATVYCTLEPCSHHGRTPPCAEALIGAGVARVVVAVEDPDPNVSGQGIARLRAAGIAVDVGVAADAARVQLAPYLTHRRTGRPYVVLKMAASLDGRTAAPDASSRWITGPAARADAHRLRAESDVVVVGAGTVRADDPSLTVRGAEGRDPQRVVLGRVPDVARVRPCVEYEGDLTALLDELGEKGVVQVLVEGGAGVAAGFHTAGLVDRYVMYVAPVLFGGDDAQGVFAGDGAATIDDVWRGTIVDVTPFGDDLRITVEPGGGR